MVKTHKRTGRRKTQRRRDFSKSAWTIRFKTEGELREQLESLLSLFERPRSRRGQFDELAAAESCLSLIQCVGIVAQALAPKAFIPTEKLGDTYLTSQERELFKARVVKGVAGAKCDITEADVPAGEGTTHSAVVNAVRKRAHA